MLTLSQMTNFRPFKTERVCRRRVKFDENGERFSKKAENNVTKGEITCYENFLYFPLSFPRDCFLQAHKNNGLFGKGLRMALQIKKINIGH